jgi:hypothetical protein
MPSEARARRVGDRIREELRTFCSGTWTTRG